MHVSHFLSFVLCSLCQSLSYAFPLLFFFLRSPHATAELFKSLKVGRQDADVDAAMSLGNKSVFVDEDSLDSTADAEAGYSRPCFLSNAYCSLFISHSFYFSFFSVYFFLSFCFSFLFPFVISFSLYLIHTLYIYVSFLLFPLPYSIVFSLSRLIASAAARDILLSLPGIEPQNYKTVMKHASSIAELSRLGVHKLTPLIGPTNAKKLSDFFSRRI